MSNKITFVDMFCGIGGFHFAFNNLGAKCVFACDNNKYARQTYELNFRDIDPELFENGHFAEDIIQVNPEDMPNFDVFCAGFPCQPFSTAGYRKGFDDPNRGNMFFEVLRLIKSKRLVVLFCTRNYRVRFIESSKKFSFFQYFCVQARCLHLSGGSVLNAQV